MSADEYHRCSWHGLRPRLDGALSIDESSMTYIDGHEYYLRALFPDSESLGQCIRKIRKTLKDRGRPVDEFEAPGRRRYLFQVFENCRWSMPTGSPVTPPWWRPHASTHPLRGIASCWLINRDDGWKNVTEGHVFLYEVCGTTLWYWEWIDQHHRLEKEKTRDGADRPRSRAERGEAPHEARRQNHGGNIRVQPRTHQEDHAPKEQ